MGTLQPKVEKRYHLIFFLNIFMRFLRVPIKYMASICRQCVMDVPTASLVAWHSPVQSSNVNPPVPMKTCVWPKYG